MHPTLETTVLLQRGVTMPQLGLGTYKSQQGAEVEQAVETALRLGYRSIDTASVYGNEAGIGAGVRGSAVPREQIFLTTKVWNDEQGYEGTLAACERSLQRLDTGYVDLYLVHWPIRAHLESTWSAMGELLAAGKTRAIGVCNFLPHHLEELLRVAIVPPAVDQVEFHPWLQQPALQRYLAEQGIALEAWAPIMKGRVGEVPELVALAQAHGVSPTQVAIRWVLQQGYIAIPKSTHADRIAQNADVFGFELTEREMTTLATVDVGRRLGPDPDTYAW